MWNGDNRLKMISKIISIILGLFLTNISFAADRLNILTERRFGTQYFDIKAVEYGFDGDLQKELSSKSVGAGAIYPLFGKLLYVSSNGNFYLIDTATLGVRARYIPSIDLGVSNFQQTKKYKYIETFPRVHDIRVDKDVVYVTYDKYYPKEDRIKFELASYDLSIKNLSKDWKIIWRSPFLEADFYQLSSGGRLEINSKGIYLSVGDHNLIDGDSIPAAQDPNHYWGKIIFIPKGGVPTIFSSGHRNPQGLSFLNDGRLISSEHGPKGGDEINLIRAGANYGWPYFSYGTEYNSYKKTNKKQIDWEASNRYEEPIYSFVPSVATSQIIQLSNFDPLWNKDLILGSLKAMSLYRLRLKGDHIQYVEPIYLGGRVRDVREWGKFLVVLTDDFRVITLKPIPNKKNFLEKIKQKVTKKDDTLLDKNIANLSRCVVCHSLENNVDGRFAPHLFNIVNRPIAGTTFPNYSNGMLKFKKIYPELVWTEQSLKIFLKNPEVFIPGTTMPNLNLTTQEIEKITHTLYGK